ncbi:MAG: TSUP family transporter [Cellvibrionaceae bacterium]|nr:TSUP family transporter [Cellvibrionaceae bacterium]
MEALLSGTVDNAVIIMFFVAIIAGFVDAIAGGGGLITVPSMLLLGIHPLIVLGTNRLQAVIGELVAYITFWANGQLKVKGLGVGILTTVIGALLGSYCVNLLPKETLQMLLPVLMAAITCYAVFSKRLQRNQSATPMVSNKTFMVVGGLLIGFYNGFFGPGTGAIWILALVLMLGMVIKEASICTKPLNFIGNLTSLLFFIGVSSVDYRLGLVMGAGQIIGSVLGSYLVIKEGDRLVRPVFITVTLAMTVKLLYENLSSAA